MSGPALAAWDNGGAFEFARGAIEDREEAGDAGMEQFIKVKNPADEALNDLYVAADYLSVFTLPEINQEHSDLCICADSMLEAIRHLLGTMRYKDYLETQWWKETRDAAVVRAGNRCQLCNQGGITLNVHHRTYERRGCERHEDLITLCRPCHAKFHDKLP